MFNTKLPRFGGANKNLVLSNCSAETLCPLPLLLSHCLQADCDGLASRLQHDLIEAQGLVPSHPGGVLVCSALAGQGGIIPTFGKL
jgi:hypothetical protein